MPQTQRNPVHVSSATEREDPSPRINLQPILRQAVVDAGWKQSALAAALNKPESYVSMQLNGQRPLSLDQLEEYPPEIFHAFLVLLNRDVLGSMETLLDAAETFSAAAKDAVRVLRLLSPDLGHRRMATAQMKEDR